MKQYKYADCLVKYNQKLTVWEVFDWGGNKLLESRGVKPVRDQLRKMRLKGEGPWGKKNH